MSGKFDLLKQFFFFSCLPCGGGTFLPQCYFSLLMLAVTFAVQRSKAEQEQRGESYNDH